ncbi:unnamed protein product [Phytophthora fragariaefolia]|uniref:Unnamed protein product n=1 Tax=Phytophthora fragariaefolia TaxID=1490495 RepID=A0A9W7CIT6_9STRA|nr:unnamed protein product [Phytophthora fragariaefolia]
MGSEDDDDGSESEYEEQCEQPNQAHGDTLESMDWWVAMTPGQQRSMMIRFVIQPPPVATPVATATPTAAAPAFVQVHRAKVKKLDIEDFRGTPGESIETWLATVRQAVQRQAMLGGDTWTSVKLYYGVTAHLRRDVNKWLALKYTINGYGEYEEGRKVTSWRGAQRHYHANSGDTDEEEQKSSATLPKNTRAVASKTMMSLRSSTLIQRRIKDAIATLDSFMNSDDTGISRLPVEAECPNGRQSVKAGVPLLKTSTKTPLATVSVFA